MVQGYEILVNIQIPRIDLSLQLRLVVRSCYVLINGLEQAILANPIRHSSITLRNQRWRLEGERGNVGWEVCSLGERNPLLGAIYSFRRLHIQLARWARKQDMKMMYIMAPTGPSADTKALYKTKSLYQYTNSNLQDSE